MIFVYVCSTWVIFKLKTRFETWITGNDVNGVRLYHPSYLITLMSYLCSQWTRNIQHKYFMFGWSIFTIYVLHRAWKRDSLQIIIFVYICSTLNLVELKTRFETWITINDVNSVSLFHRSYLISLMVYLRSQQTPNVQINYFMCYCSIFTLFVLNRGCKRDYLQIMLFVYVCSTWVIFELKPHFETWITGNDVNGVR
jgi:hypothetical protein